MMMDRPPFEDEMNKPCTVEERRQDERFSLKLPTRIFPLDSDTLPVDLVTENISASGAFFLTPKSLPEGLMVLVEVTLRRESGEGDASRVKVRGRVLPSRTNGMAISFETRAQMASLS
jgi:c-di-GMP-binding flagellar brake protein YcgR